MKRFIVLTFVDPTKTWNRDFSRYFLEKILKKFGIKEDIKDVDLVVKGVEITPDTGPSRLLGSFFRDKNPEIIGVFVQAHESLEINQKILFLAEILREENRPIEIFFVENEKITIINSIFQGKMEGEKL